MSSKRLDPALRKEQIIAAGLELAKSKGFYNVTREMIAEKSGCVGGTIQYHFSTMTVLRRDIMRAAVRKEVLEVIAQGIVNKSKVALRVSPELRKRALAVLK